MGVASLLAKPMFVHSRASAGAAAARCAGCPRLSSSALANERHGNEEHRMNKSRAARGARWWIVAAACAAGMPVHAGDALDMGTSVPEAKAVKEGLFPEDACKELESA